MKKPHIVKGFSKLTRLEKIEWLKVHSGLSEEAMNTLNTHLHPDQNLQDIYGEIRETSEHLLDTYQLFVNILRQLSASPGEVSLVKKEFSGRPISHAGIENFLQSVRIQEKKS